MALSSSTKDDSALHQSSLSKHTSKCLDVNIEVMKSTATVPIETKKELVALYREAFRDELAWLRNQGKATTCSMQPSLAFSWVFGGKTVYIARRSSKSFTGSILDSMVLGFATSEQQYINRFSPLFVRSIAVHRNARRHGIGQKLLQTIFAQPSRMYEPEVIEKFSNKCNLANHTSYALLYKQHVSIISTIIEVYNFAHNA